MNRVKDRVCIITGAALGIGQPCARRLAEEGAQLALFDVLDEAGPSLIEELQARGARARYWRVDVESERSEHEAIDGVVVQQYGAIHVLVNIAGISGINKPTH